MLPHYHAELYSEQRTRIVCEQFGEVFLPPPVRAFSLPQLRRHTQVGLLCQAGADGLHGCLAQLAGVVAHWAWCCAGSWVVPLAGVTAAALPPPLPGSPLPGYWANAAGLCYALSTESTWAHVLCDASPDKSYRQSPVDRGL